MKTSSLYNPMATRKASDVAIHAPRGIQALVRGVMVVPQQGTRSGEGWRCGVGGWEWYRCNCGGLVGRPSLKGSRRLREVDVRLCLLRESDVQYASSLEEVRACVRWDRGEDLW